MYPLTTLISAMKPPLNFTVFNRAHFLTLYLIHLPVIYTVKRTTMRREN
jgi:hypothetical protein